MSQRTIEDKVRDILIARFGTDPKHQKPDAKIGSDDFDRSGLVWDLEDKFGIQISHEEEWKIDTIQDVIRLIRSKLPNG